MQHANLDFENRLRYESISYCWGKDDLRAEVEVNGQAINVPQSCRTALQKVRLADRDRVVWIDALCINQIDTAERSAQVTLMGLIYRCAKQNLIVLGEDNNDAASRALHVLQMVVHRIRIAAEKLSDESRQYLASGSLPSCWTPNTLVNESEIAALQPLYKLSWFRRLWVVQESSLALRNICFWGRDVCSLEDILLVAAVYDGAATLSLPHCYDQDSRDGLFGASFMWEYVMRDYQSFKTPPMVLTEFRWLPRRLVSAEPRDRVYALIEMFRLSAGLSKVPDLLMPDFKKSIADVYRDASRFMLQEPNTDDRIYTSQAVLSHICHRSEADMTARNLPSWSCKWDRECFDPELDWHPLDRWFKAGVPPGTKNPFCAGVVTALSNNPNELVLRGFTIGTVESSSSPMTGCALSDHREVKQIIRQVCSMAKSSIGIGIYHPRQKSMIVSQLLTAGSSGLSQHGIGFNSSLEKLSAIRHFFADVFTDLSLPPLPHCLPQPSVLELLQSSKYYGLFSSMARHRCLFECSAGHIGLGPKVMRAGDLVVIPEGVQHPFIFRRFNEGTYQHVGAGYIPGLMAGEVFSMGLQEEWSRVR